MSVTVTDQTGRWVRQEFDRSGDLVAEVRPAPNGGGESRTSHVYGPLGRLITSTDPVGVVTSYTYDVNGNVIDVTVGGVLESHTTYDKLGRVTRSEGPAGDVDGMGAPIRMTTTYEYDRVGRVRKTVAAPGTAAEVVRWTLRDVTGRDRYSVVDRGVALNPVAPVFEAVDVVSEQTYTKAGRPDATYVAPIDTTSWAYVRTAARKSMDIDYFGASSPFAGVARDEVTPLGKTSTTYNNRSVAKQRRGRVGLMVGG